MAVHRRGVAQELDLFAGGPGRGRGRGLQRGRALQLRQALDLGRGLKLGRAQARLHKAVAEHFLEPIVFLDLSQEGLHPAVLVAIAGHAAVIADSVGHKVDVLLCGVRVPGEDILMIAKAHAG